MISVIVFVAMLLDMLSGNKNSSVNNATGGVIPHWKPTIKVGATPAFLMSVLFLLLLSMISGCAGKAILSDDAVRIRNTVDMIEQLRGLYEQRDESMISFFSEEYLSGSGVKDAIMKDMRKFSSISLDMFIDRIEVDNDLARVSVHWKGLWGSGENTLREGGSAVIIIRSGDGLKVADIKGDSPFGISNK